MADDKPVNRRRFFREGLRELLKPLAQSIDPIERAARQIGNIEKAAEATAGARLRTYLRPPGALPGQSFLDTCSRCQACVNVCPAECIKMDSSGRIMDGAPYIDVEQAPCVVCEGLKCMHSCPSGALAPIPLSQIDMGVADWRGALCVRMKGEDCTICIDECPLGETAIGLRGNYVHVKTEGCIGCGVCQNRCPTTPKSIVVRPRKG